jgi:alanine racemase
MPYTIRDISLVLKAKGTFPYPEVVIENLLIDSRRVIHASSTLFFALRSDRRNGGEFIEELYENGLRNFVVERSFSTTGFPEANFIEVDIPLKALQEVAAFHRQHFTIPVIGITGSNGKTIVKEWLYHLLQPEYNIVRSPKSYNSQIGVPLSVWQMNKDHNLGIFEAGISEPHEMEALEEIIRPTIGILTNIGAAHSAGFATQQDKLIEKWKLFKNASTIVCKNNSEPITPFVKAERKNRMFTWGDKEASLQITEITKRERETDIQGYYEGKNLSITIPFIDNASVENAITCWCILLFLKIDHSLINQRMKELQPIEMRLQFKKANNNCSLINDSYSNDISSLRMALNFLEQQAGNQIKTVILSDLGESQSSDEQYEKVRKALLENKVDKFIGIGPRLTALQHTFTEAIPKSFFYPSVEDFIHQFINTNFRDEVILLKGARHFQFEQINLLFEQKIHQTVLEVNLTAMGHNLKEYQNYLKPQTKVMAMVKAFSYGAGSAEVASVLQFHKVDYLAVAYADEGVDLRKAGIQLPVMVMNPETIAFQSLVEYNLEPEMYSFAILNAFNKYLENEGVQQFPVHIKIDTGMHRLGFEMDQLDELVTVLQETPRLVIKSVFSHLVASENEEHDNFTHHQAARFIEAFNAIQNAVGYSFIRHIANSAAIFRHPGYQFDLVRLGIGLYGVDSIAESKLSLQTVATLRSTIAQIRKVAAGESVGYSRRGIVSRDSFIATIRIGYADGFNRLLGNGIGRVFIKGHLAPVIGNVCMDMTMIDVTDVEDAREGDIVEIFGANLHVAEVAKWCNTIPYEIMTSISQRVKREYYQE